MQETKALDEPIFRALLTPHRSMGRKGFLIIMSIFAVTWLGTGAFFMSLGAWPVFGFFGLDLLLLYIAFKVNYRAARAREEVTVSRTALEILKVAPSGKCQQFSFNPFWAKFRVQRHEEIGITDMAVEGEGRRVPIGSFLNPDDRESFAAAFGSALATAKR